MAADDSRQRVGREVTRGKQVLPGPFLGGVWILPLQGVRQIDRAMAGSQVLVVQHTRFLHLVLEQRKQ